MVILSVQKAESVEAISQKSWLSAYEAQHSLGIVGWTRTTIIVTFMRRNVQGQSRELGHKSNQAPRILQRAQRLRGHQGERHYGGQESGRTTPQAFCEEKYT